MRIASLCIPHFHATVALRRQPHLRGRPAVIADHAPGTSRIVDATLAAAGVVAGMMLTAALSRCPEATVLAANIPACRRLFQQLCRALQGVSDRVDSTARHYSKSIGLSHVLRAAGSRSLRSS